MTKDPAAIEPHHFHTCSECSRVWECSRKEACSFIGCKLPCDNHVNMFRFTRTTMPKNPAAIALGSIKSDKKALSSRENGKKGGRPPKKEMK